MALQPSLCTKRRNKVLRSFAKTPLSLPVDLEVDIINVNLKMKESILKYPKLKTRLSVTIRLCRHQPQSKDFLA